MASFFAQPEDVRDARPPFSEIRREAHSAWVHVVDARSEGWAGFVGMFTRDSRALMRFAALKLWDGLSDLNNLLLPPLFTLIILDLISGGLPGVVIIEFGTANYVFGAFFLVEWLLGLFLARSRRAYVMNVWLLADLLSAVPITSAFQFLRISRFGRLLRFAKLLKLLRGRRVLFPLGRIAWGIAITFSLATAGALALQSMEPELVPTFSDAIWWSLVTVTTVGYGDIAPVTPPGRAVAVCLMISGIGVFTYLAGVMANVVFDPEEDEILRTVKRLELQIQQISEALEDK